MDARKLLTFAVLAQAPAISADSTQARPVMSLMLPGAVSVLSTSPSAASPTAFKTIATHTAVGAGAGLVIGLVLSGSSMDDESSVVLTWTAIGAAAGIVSGLVTWLVARNR